MGHSSTTSTFNEGPSSCLVNPQTYRGRRQSSATALRSKLDAFAPIRTGRELRDTGIIEACAVLLNAEYGSTTRGLVQLLRIVRPHVRVYDQRTAPMVGTENEESNARTPQPRAAPGIRLSAVSVERTGWRSRYPRARHSAAFRPWQTALFRRIQPRCRCLVPLVQRFRRPQTPRNALLSSTPWLPCSRQRGAPRGMPNMAPLIFAQAASSSETFDAHSSVPLSSQQGNKR